MLRYFNHLTGTRCPSQKGGMLRLLCICQTLRHLSWATRPRQVSLNLTLHSPPDHISQPTLQHLADKSPAELSCADRTMHKQKLSTTTTDTQPLTEDRTIKRFSDSVN